MKDLFKKYLLIILIMVIIGILLFFNYFYYKLSPTMLYDNHDKEVLELFETNNDLSDLELESRYALEDIFYSASDKDNLYFFLEDGNLVLTRDKTDLDIEKALDIANDNYKNLDNKIRLAVYKKEPVYVIVNKDYDVFLDFDDLKEVFKYRKGIGND